MTSSSLPVRGVAVRDAVVGIADNDRCSVLLPTVCIQVDGGRTCQRHQKDQQAETLQIAQDLKLFHLRCLAFLRLAFVEQPCAAQHHGNGLHQGLFQAQALQEGGRTVGKGNIVLGFVLDIRLVQYKQLLRDLVDGGLQLVHHGLRLGQTRLARPSSSRIFWIT